MTWVAATRVVSVLALVTICDEVGVHRARRGEGVGGGLKFTQAWCVLCAIQSLSVGVGRVEM